VIAVLITALLAVGEAGLHWFMIERRGIDLEKNDQEGRLPNHYLFVAVRLLLLYLGVSIFGFQVALLIPLYYVLFQYPLNYFRGRDSDYLGGPGHWFDGLVSRLLGRRRVFVTWAVALIGSAAYLIINGL